MKKLLLKILNAIWGFLTCKDLKDKPMIRENPVLGGMFTYYYYAMFIRKLVIYMTCFLLLVWLMFKIPEPQRTKQEQKEYEAFLKHQGGYKLMFEKLIKEIQKFINTPFRYADLVLFLDKKKDFLLSKNILENSDMFEYNAMWDMMDEVEEQLKIFEDKNLVILSEINIQETYRYHLSIRKIINNMEESKEQKEARLKKLMEGLELTKSGYAGIDKNGNKVDRRQFPDAVPLQYNPSLGIPHPKEI